MNINASFLLLSTALLCMMMVSLCDGFSIVTPSSTTSSISTRQHLIKESSSSVFSPTALFMSSNERDTKRTTKKGVQTIDKVETKAEEEKKKEEMWRVVLHNDEVHTFNYVVRSLTKVIGTLDRKAAFEICVETHGIGKATITKTWKKQAEQFCLGLQRQGLTVSISPDEDFEGGHSGGGL
jgi:ATP-dependent Clp protease adapter protein ClpS